MSSVLGNLPTSDLLADLSQTLVDEVRASNDRLVLVAAYLAQHPPRGADDVAYDDDPCLLGDRAMPLAGEGAPSVSEFAVIGLGPVLRLSVGSVRKLAGDVLELSCRLPRVWARVVDYTVEGWRARQVAEATRWLSPEAVDWVDANIAPQLHKRGRISINNLVAKALAMFDPEAAAIAAEEKAEQHRVEIDLSSPSLFDEDLSRLGAGAVNGQAYVTATMDLADAADLENAVAALAKDLAKDDRYTGWSRGRRRAKALGELGRRHTAANSGANTGENGGETTGGTGGWTTTGDDITGTASGGGADAAGAETAGGTARVLHLYCHVDGGDLRGTGLVSVDNFGAVVPLERIHEWANTPGTVVRPVKVIDLNTKISRDGYVPSATQHEQVALITGETCAFPGCTRSAWHADTDHIDAYDHNNPGQASKTTTANLAKICRTHHRLKTFGGWTYTQTSPGTYTWRSPLGIEYLRHPDGTYEEVASTAS